MASAGHAADTPRGRREALKLHWSVLPLGRRAMPAELDEVAWDAASRELTIVYVAALNGVRVRGCDLVKLDAAGRIVSGEPCALSIVDEPLVRGHTRARDRVVSEIAGGRL